MFLFLEVWHHLSKYMFSPFNTIKVNKKSLSFDFRIPSMFWHEVLLCSPSLWENSGSINTSVPNWHLWPKLCKEMISILKTNLFHASPCNSLSSFISPELFIWGSKAKSVPQHVFDVLIRLAAGGGGWARPQAIGSPLSQRGSFISVDFIWFLLRKSTASRELHSSAHQG